VAGADDTEKQIREFLEILAHDGRTTRKTIEVTVNPRAGALAPLGGAS
jgi:hypothetical protein